MLEDKNKKGLEDAKTAVEEVLNPGRTVAEAIGLMVSGADELNKKFGLGRARIVEMNKAFSDSAAGVEKLGGNLSDVVNTISDIAKGSNRNVLVNEEVVSTLYAAAKVLNTERTDSSSAIGRLLTTATVIDCSCLLLSMRIL
jgi:methyl-accepting chemotaxis protein